MEVEAAYVLHPGDMHCGKQEFVTKEGGIRDKMETHRHVIAAVYLLSWGFATFELGSFTTPKAGIEYVENIPGQCFHPLWDIRWFNSLLPSHEC